jgi:PP-loop superfamily ATP-utilizing enzyme
MKIKNITESNLRNHLVENVRQLGFLHIAVDLERYVSGNMNQAVKNAREKGRDQ